MTQVKMFIHFHAVHSARVPSTHYRSQHIQVCTYRYLTSPP